MKPNFKQKMEEHFVALAKQLVPYRPKTFSDREEDLQAASRVTNNVN